MTYIVQADIEARVSAAVLVQILDDNEDGVVDTVPLARLIADSEAYVEGFLRGNYDLAALRAMGTACPSEVKRLCLDVAVSFLWDRFPEYVRADGAALMRRAREDMVALRQGVTRLDVIGTPEPAANQGGATLSSDPDEPDVADKVFLDGLGDF